jgi:hypothetical protein
MLCVWRKPWRKVHVISRAFTRPLAALPYGRGRTVKPEKSDQIAPLVRLFAYGFGFGNLLSLFFRSLGPNVRDLLQLPGTSSSTVAVDQLAKDWTTYKRHVEGLATEMLGSTPMLEGFRVVGERLRLETSHGSYYGQPVIFVLSDGEPTDDPSGTEVLKIAEGIKREGTIIVSCYVTAQDIAEPRRLYGAAPTNWPSGAKLMHECASILPLDSAFSSYLKEYRWKVDNGGRLFTQINQAETLSEFMSVVLSPLREQEHTPAVSRVSTIRVFVSYSHQDTKYLERGSLLGYLSGLERESFVFWQDTSIQAGELWDDAIKEQIERADIALVLVSQAFLNSRYCLDVEIEHFLEKRIESGLVIFPVILSPCDWKSHAWLSATQFEHRNGRTIERNYRDKGSRDELYLQILQQLREIGQRIMSGRGATRGGIV